MAYAPYAPPDTNLSYLSNPGLVVLSDNYPPFGHFHSSRTPPASDPLAPTTSTPPSSPPEESVLVHLPLNGASNKLPHRNQVRIWAVLNAHRKALEEVGCDLTNVPGKAEQVSTRVKDFFVKHKVEVEIPPPEEEALMALNCHGGLTWSNDVIENLLSLNGGSAYEATFDDISERGILLLIQELSPIRVPRIFPNEVAQAILSTAITPLIMSLRALLETYGDTAKRYVSALLIALFLLPCLVFYIDDTDRSRQLALELFKTGNFEKLVERARTTMKSYLPPQASAKSGTKNEGDHFGCLDEGLTPESKCSRTHTLVRETLAAGEVSRAMQVLTSSTPPLDTPESRRKYRDKVTKNLNPSSLPQIGRAHV